MNHLKIAFFDAKPYDIESFNEVNSTYGYTVKYFKFHLTPDNIVLVQGYDAVVIFVNDTVDAGMIMNLKQYGVKLIALRSAGFNNVDLKAALNNIRVARVPAYSPHAIGVGSPKYHGLASWPMRTGADSSAVNRRRERSDLDFISYRLCD